MQVLGIDLGTTNTATAIDSHVFAISSDGKASLPSVVAFPPNGHTQTGEPARRRRAIDSENTIYSSKRIIGRRWSDSDTQSFRRLYPFRLVEDAEGMPVFETRSGAYSATQVAGILLSVVRERARSIPDEFEVNVTVPAAFNRAQRTATADAAVLAGLRRARLIEESMATAYAYLSLPRSIRRAVVYDFGGGTFDCTVVDCSDGTPHLIAHAGDSFLGGDDIDQLLGAWVVQHVLEKHEWDLSNYSEVYDRLLAHCENAKILLSHQQEAVVHLSQVDPECPADEDGVIVTRCILEELCRDLVQRTFVTCDAVLHEAGARPRDIDAVFLAGGTTHLPVIQRGIESYFGRPGLLEFEPMEVVALGASLVKR